ncbi:MAG TPA: zinc ribbon domain-containing protein, partial [Pyrinomonadaceae bacterium]
MSLPEISRRCLACGAAVRAGARFCPQCGRLFEAGAGAQEAAAEGRADSTDGRLSPVTGEMEAPTEWAPPTREFEAFVGNAPAAEPRAEAFAPEQLPASPARTPYAEPEFEAAAAPRAPESWDEDARPAADAAVTDAAVAEAAVAEAAVEDAA